MGYVVNGVIIGLLLMSVGNLIVRSVERFPSTAHAVLNSVLMILSGVMLNVGACFQICGMLTSQHLDRNFVKCQWAGICMLLLGQVYGLVYSDVRSLELVCTAVTSAFCLITASIIWWLQQRARRSHAFASLRAQTLVPAARRRDVLVLEGTSAIGKTTAADRTFDFDRYVRRVPDYMDKARHSWIQAVYDLEFYVDKINHGLDMREGKTLLLGSSPYIEDRNPYSQIVYDLLIECDGLTASPNVFAENLNRVLRSRPALATTIGELMGRWTETMQRLYGTDYRYIDVCGISTDVEATVAALKKRGNFDANENVYDPKRYVTNQNTIFETFHGLRSRPDRARLLSVVRFDRETLTLERR